MERSHSASDTEIHDNSRSLLSPTACEKKIIFKASLSRFVEEYQARRGIASKVRSYFAADCQNENYLPTEIQLIKNISDFEPDELLSGRMILDPEELQMLNDAIALNFEERQGRPQKLRDEIIDELVDFFGLNPEQRPSITYFQY